MSTTTQPDTQPHLKRVLGRRDLVLLFVVAVFNLNVVPSIAANGGVTVWLWIISLALFFWPQGIAVVELAHRYPGEGGVYLWAKEVFGDFHGFLSGWCYWTNNMLYVPTVMLYFVGVSVYVLGLGHLGLADNKIFASTTSLVLLALLTVLNIVGLGVGKWINNFGAIGTFIAAAVLIGLGAVIWLRYGTTITAADFKIPPDPRFVLNSFGVICFGLVGLELASVMGDEIQDPSRTLPGAVAWGGILSGALYLGATLTLLIAVGKNVNVLQGIVQAVSHMSGILGLGWLTIPFALMLSLSIAGIGSAWMGGSARIPFVAGLDSYMPSWLGRIHPRYATPYAALIVQAIVSALLVIMNLFVAGVQETFEKLLSLAVVLQLVPFLYMFGALIRFAVKETAPQGHYSRTTLFLAGTSGLLTTILGIALVFFPAQQVTSPWPYELWMFGGTMFFIGLAAFFFFIYGRSAELAKPGHQGPPPWDPKVADYIGIFLGPIAAALIAAGNLRRMGDVNKARSVLAVAFLIVPLFLLVVGVRGGGDETITLLVGSFIAGPLLLSSQENTFKQWRNQNPSAPLAGTASAWARSLAGAAIYALMLSVLFVLVH